MGLWKSLRTRLRPLAFSLFTDLQSRCCRYMTRESGLSWRRPLLRRTTAPSREDVALDGLVAQCGPGSDHTESSFRVQDGVVDKAGSCLLSITCCVFTYLALSASRRSTALGLRALLPPSNCLRRYSGPLFNSPRGELEPARGAGLSMATSPWGSNWLRKVKQMERVSRSRRQIWGLLIQFW